MVDNSKSLNEMCSYTMRKSAKSKVLPGYEKINKKFDEKSSLDGMQKQEVKQILADENHIAETSEENAVDLENQARDIIDNDKCINDIVNDMSEKLKEKQLRQQRAVKANIDAELDLEKSKLLVEIENEIVKEQERAKLLYMLENSRKNAIDAARATYGNKADIVSIQKAYDIMANNIDPKATDLTDMISVSLDNKLHKSDLVRMLMPNGSIRLMNVDVALALSDKPSKNMFVKNVKNQDFDIQFTDDELDKLYELEELMQKNIECQEKFALQNPSSGYVYQKSEREKRFRTLGLPEVGIDYEYLCYNNQDDLYNRRLPSSMDTMTMQQGIIASGKTYGV